MKAHFNTVNQVRRMGAFGFSAQAIAKDTGLTVADVRRLLHRRSGKRKYERACAWKMMKEGVPLNLSEKSCRISESLCSATWKNRPVPYPPPIHRLRLVHEGLH
jgi:hypothetical protein